MSRSVLLFTLLLAAALPATAKEGPLLFLDEARYPSKDAPQRALMLGERLVVQLGAVDVALVDTAHARILWRVTPGGAVTDVAVRGGDVLVTADDLRLYAGADGSLRWVYPLSGQRLLDVGRDIAVVAGFGDAPTQVAVVDLTSGAPRWPSWAQVGAIEGARIDGERILMRSGAQVIPVDITTGRTRAAQPPAPEAPAPAPWRAETVAGRTLLLGPGAAAWLEAAARPARIEVHDGRLMVVLPDGVRVLRPAPLGEQVLACRAELAEARDACVADLEPLVTRLEGAGAVVAPVLLDAALSRADSPAEPLQLEQVRRALALLESVDGATRAPLLVRTALLVPPLTVAGRLVEADTTLAAVEGLATADGPELTELRLGVSTAQAKERLDEAQQAYKRKDDEEAVRLLDSMVSLPGLGALLPGELVDARDGRKELRAALKAVRAALPQAGSLKDNAPLCNATCGLEYKACGSGATCRPTLDRCLAKCGR